MKILIIFWIAGSPNCQLMQGIKLDGIYDVSSVKIYFEKQKDMNQKLDLRSLI